MITGANILQMTETRNLSTALPFSNTGVLNTDPPPETQTRVSIDYVRFTIPLLSENFVSLAEFVTGKGERMPTGMNGYTHRSAVLKTGFVLWNPKRTDMGIHVVLPSTALAGIKLTAIGLMNWVRDKGGWFTRLDIAFDDFAGVIDIAEMDRKLRAGEVVTRWRSAKTQKGDYEIGVGIDRGDGVTVGSRSSDSYLRVYDKKKERDVAGKPFGGEHWVRVELEVTGKKCAKLAQMLADTAYTGDAGQLAANLLYGLIDFKEPSDDNNKSRWNTCSWWSDFIMATRKERVSLPKDEKTLDEVKQWWSKSIAPMTAVILLAGTSEGEIDGYDWLMTAIFKGQERLKAHHKRLINGQNSNENLTKPV